ncbi:MAG TPA: hypothetical protein DDZ80_15105 [Cyanobacteria bacterium UBA8803]|nr:hypothetical protein [Cyanobacteria bacterium UBA9273]HBL59749.1 hypothetical protein [Cyanobacteria bacterium UBA8803]
MQTTLYPVGNFAVPVFEYGKDDVWIPLTQLDIVINVQRWRLYRALNRANIPTYLTGIREREKVIHWSVLPQLLIAVNQAQPYAEGAAALLSTLQSQVA